MLMIEYDQNYNNKHYPVRVVYSFFQKLARVRHAVVTSFCVQWGRGLLRGAFRSVSAKKATVYYCEFDWKWFNAFVKGRQKTSFSGWRENHSSGTISRNYTDGSKHVLDICKTLHVTVLDYIGFANNFSGFAHARQKHCCNQKTQQHTTLILPKLHISILLHWTVKSYLDNAWMRL